MLTSPHILIVLPDLLQLSFETATHFFGLNRSVEPLISLDLCQLQLRLQPGEKFLVHIIVAASLAKLSEQAKLRGTTASFNDVLEGLLICVPAEAQDKRVKEDRTQTWTEFSRVVGEPSPMPLRNVVGRAARPIDANRTIEASERLSEPFREYPRILSVIDGDELRAPRAWTASGRA